MTPEEIHAAAERYRENKYPSGIGKTLDRIALADAYLAERDQEPVTEEWLREIGFRTIYQHALEIDDLWLDTRDGKWYFGTSKILTPTTRGDVRRLCRALGIEVKS